MAQQLNPEESDGTLGVPIPAGANQLVVKTSNAAGIMDGPGVWTSVSWSRPVSQCQHGKLGFPLEKWENIGNYGKNWGTPV